MLIDTHVHLDDQRYDTDRIEMFSRAQDAGVEAFITIGCDLATSRAAVELADQHPNIYAAIGVHPHEVKHIEDAWYRELAELAKHPKVVGYGEIGLDFHYDHSPRDIQRRRFREQIQLARELHLPIVIHTREAQEDTITILDEEHASQTGGVFHCFSGDAWLAQQALRLGFYLSFSGIITFQKASALRDIVQTIPDDRLLIETDGPYLTPVPFRGKRNESAYVKKVAEKIAEIKGGATLSNYERIASLTTDNARALFKISSSS
ncbi:MAG: TatD family hydrolase [Nitrospirales bacterium]|nr:TatD family hydrolase [Nitrospira sp.]MDR4499906.1 TatD family hydrolase [Nitrospirales bacterium]